MPRKLVFHSSQFREAEGRIMRNRIMQKEETHDCLVLHALMHRRVAFLRFSLFEGGSGDTLSAEVFASVLLGG
jgi:hypothetical protein